MSVVPPRTARLWRDVLIGEEPRFQSLATRLVVTRLRDGVREDRPLNAAIEELHRYFDTNSFATRDLSNL